MKNEETIVNEMMKLGYAGTQMVSKAQLQALEEVKSFLSGRDFPEDVISSIMDSDAMSFMFMVGVNAGRMSDKGDGPFHPSVGGFGDVTVYFAHGVEKVFNGLTVRTYLDLKQWSLNPDAANVYELHYDGEIYHLEKDYRCMMKFKPHRKLRQGEWE